MNNKEYGVKLDVDISKFTEKLEKAKELANKTKNDIETPLRKVKITQDGQEREIKLKSNVKEITKDFEKLESVKKRIESGSIKISNGDSGNVVGLMSTPEEDAFWKMFSNMKGPVEDVNIDLEELKENVDEIPPKIEESTEKTKQFGNETEKVKNKSIDLTASFTRLGDSIGKNLQKSVSSIKRFTLSLIGIRGIYTMLTRASNAYMSQDEKLHTKLQANWIALGAMFEPVIQKLVSLFQKLIAYVNVFWKAFTGKNLIDIALKKVQKTANKTTKSVKELNKELANVDEITNLNFDQGGGNIDVGSDGDYSIEDALNEIKNLKLNQNFVDAMTWLGETFKNIKDKVEKLQKKLEDWGIPLNEIIKLVAVIFGASEVGRIVAGITKIIGVAGGTAGIYGMITALALVDVYLAKTLVDDIIELGKVWRQQQKAEIQLGDSRINTMSIALDRIEEINSLLEQGNLTEEEQKKLSDERNTLIDEAQKSYVKFNQEKKDGVGYTQAQVDLMDDYKDRIETVTNKKWKVDVEINAYQSKESKNAWDKFMEGVRGAFYGSYVPGAVITTHGGGGRHFAKGNVAYEPTYAEFGEYAGARSNPEITAPQNMIRQTLSEALVEAIPQIQGNNGDTILYVNGRELARATYSDFKNEGNRLGSSSVAVRRVS